MKKMRRCQLVCLLVALVIVSGIAIKKTSKIDIPFIGISLCGDAVWSIGIYELYYDGLSLGLIPYENNPVLTAKDIKDRASLFVADPFLFYDDKLYYIFFETLGLDNGDIGLAASEDGVHWRYEKIVLDEPFHLSYPCVFKWKGNYYMIPETHEKGAVRLYKARNFPYRWQFIKTLIEGKDFADSTIFRYKNRWWIFTKINPYGKDTLLLYYADNLEGPWFEHAKNPIVKNDPNIARPGGGVMQIKNRLIRIAQDDFPCYRNSIRAFEITKLTLDEYEEHEIEESPLLKPTGEGWNRDGMHQISIQKIDSDKWLACVDGRISSKSYIYIGNFKIRLPIRLNKLSEFFE